ncbi:MAG: penicillin-binding protein 2 [Desulforegulaceae bacterium]|nr:penicillin-binding protein 2 [Desulforegulaceae bacterium]
MRKKEKKNKPDTISRVRFIKYCFYICLFIILGKAFVTQNFPSSSLKQITLNTYSKEITIKEKRGSIFDANNEVLAISIDAWDIAIRPQFKKDFSKYNLIAEITGINESKIREKINSDSNFVYLKRQASIEEIEKLCCLEKEYNIDSRFLEILKTNKRVYPNKDICAPVIGFSNRNNQRTGIESKYNNFLEGSNNQIPIISAGNGHWYKNPDFDCITKPGNNIYLTIDKNIQHFAEKAIANAVTKYEAIDGKAVVMNPNTGEILAMAQYPSFNPNVYWKSSPHSWNNRNTLDAFEPGSILKVFLAAGAIEKNFCNKNSIFYCQNGSYKIGPVTIHDTKPHKWLPVTDIIKYSSNIGAAKIAELVGKEPLYEILKDFGFGDKTEIDLPLETSGILRPPQQWTKVDTSNISFGQGMSASTVQLVTAVSAIANGGSLLKPYLVKKITDQNGNTLISNSPKIKKRAISKKTAAIITEIMEKTIVEGTGTNAMPAGYSAAGKTGTSQKLEKNGKYSRKKYISTFFGFAPSKNPEIAIVIAINEPKEEYYGGIVAAPVFKEIASQALSYMNILPKGITIALKEGSNEVR